MKKSIFTLILSLLLILLTLEANAQGDITVRLKMPPAGKLNFEDFWAVRLINNTNSEQSVYLVGTATEEKDGLIARGTTVPFKLKGKGTKNLKLKDLPKTPDIEYTARDPRYKESLRQKGEFPSGVYEVCVYVKYSRSKEDAGSDCFTHEVKEDGILSLINPSDGQDIDLKTPLIFTWLYSGRRPAEGYTLKIIEVKKEQIPEGAIERNKAFFENKGIRSTTFSYPSSAPKFDEGKKYAWCISIDNIKSEISSFNVSSKDTKNDSNNTKGAVIYIMATGQDYPPSDHSFMWYGYLPGVGASGYYYYTLERSGGFYTDNFVISYSWVSWSPGMYNPRLIYNKVSHDVQLSGIVPGYAECGTSETIIWNIYSLALHQLVQQNTIIITNPKQPIPDCNFKINGYVYPCQSEDILSNNLKLQYTGTGEVWKYHISIIEVNSSGSPIPGGYIFDQELVDGPVPFTIDLNETLIGTISGQVPSYWAYFKITLETLGGPCDGGGYTGSPGIHSEIIHLSGAVKQKIGDEEK